MYFYLSNDNYALGGAQVEVYFDDFRVEHVKSPVVQSQDYYPFGLVFNNFKSENGIPNQYLFNKGAERQDELGLEIDLTKFRAYDATIGKWWQVDPLADKQNQEPFTPYNYSFNDPIRYNDPDGDCPICAAFVALKSAYSVKYGNMSQSGKTTFQRAATGSSGSVPKEAGMDKTSRTIVKTTSTAQDTKTALTTIGKIPKEGMRDAGDAAKATGSSMKKVGLASSVVGVPEVGVPMAMVGNYISNVGTVLSVSVKVIDGDISGAGIEAGMAIWMDWVLGLSIKQIFHPRALR